MAKVDSSTSRTSSYDPFQSNPAQSNRSAESCRQRATRDVARIRSSVSARVVNSSTRKPLNSEPVDFSTTRSWSPETTWSRCGRRSPRTCAPRRRGGRRRASRAGSRRTARRAPAPAPPRASPPAAAGPARGRSPRARRRRAAWRRRTRCSSGCRSAVPPDWSPSTWAAAKSPRSELLTLRSTISWRPRVVVVADDPDDPALRLAVLVGSQPRHARTLRLPHPAARSAPGQPAQLGVAEPAALLHLGRVDGAAVEAAQHVVGQRAGRRRLVGDRRP